MSIRAQSRLISVSVTAADRASVLRGLTNGMAVWIYRGFLRIAARGYRLCFPQGGRTCVHRVGSLEASRRRPRYPGLFRRPRNTALGFVACDGAG